MLTNTASTGLRASMAQIQVIGNNVSNAGTIGFKESAVRFSDIYSTGVASGSAIGIGVEVAGVDQNFSEGSTELTGRNLDLTIRGEGFFITQNNGTGLTSYTRAGQFSQDKDGYVITGTGNRLQAYTAVDGAITANITDLRIPAAPISAQQTSRVNFDLNLDSGETVPTVAFDSANASSYNYRSDSIIYDSLGNAGTLSTYFVKTANNAWDAHTEIDGVALGSGNITFDTVGNLATTTGLTGISWSPTSGATTPQLFDIDLTGTTQLANPNQSRVVTQDGFSAGTLASFDVDDNGVLTARYSNGQTESIAQIAVAKFRAQQSLVNNGDMSWLETNMSGTPILGHANSEGSIMAGALEQSNVDITQQLVKLLTAQHGFQANAQLVRAADELNQTIVNI